MVAETMDKWGRIDILVNNAGILRDKSFHKVTIEEFNQVMDVHFQGSFYASHAVYPIMREQNFGRIIFTTSSGGLVGSFGQTNYGAAKNGYDWFDELFKDRGSKIQCLFKCCFPSCFIEDDRIFNAGGVG